MVNEGIFYDVFSAIGTNRLTSASVVDLRPKANVREKVWIVIDFLNGKQHGS